MASHKKPSIDDTESAVRRRFPRWLSALVPLAMVAAFVAVVPTSLRPLIHPASQATVSTTSPDLR